MSLNGSDMAERVNNLINDATVPLVTPPPITIGSTGLFIACAGIYCCALNHYMGAKHSLS